jgi:hypothetical protein
MSTPAGVSITLDQFGSMHVLQQHLAAVAINTKSVLTKV